MTTRKDGDKMEEHQAGIIQLGVNGEGILKVFPINDTRDLEILTLLRSIDRSLKTLLKHNEIITGSKPL